MNCPNDNTEMHQVQIKANYGQPLFLDQCDCCGGIWFDESELYRARQGEADKVDLLDTYILTASAPVVNPVHCCPKDGAKLIRFSDRNFPQSIIVERCSVCDGFWLNRGEFTKFQHAREEMLRTKEPSAEDKKLQEQVQLILAEHHAAGNNDTLSRLGKFLTTPLDEKIVLPFSSQGSDDDSSNTGNTISAVLNVLTTLLRLFVFRG
jgi:Zn-finger nucleic acid-binding protein